MNVVVGRFFEGPKADCVAPDSVFGVVNADMPVQAYQAVFSREIGDLRGSP